MNADEYDRLFRSQGVTVGGADEDLPAELVNETIEVDGRMVAPLHINVINSTPQALHERHMQQLYRGGADYSGNEGWRQFMRRIGRIR